MTPISAVEIVYTTCEVMENMEQILNVWVKNPNQGNIPLSMVITLKKSKEFYEDLRNRYAKSAEVDTFVFTYGWFQCIGLHSIAVTGEGVNTDREPCHIRFYHRSYTPQQVFNIDYTGLY